MSGSATNTPELKSAPQSFQVNVLDAHGLPEGRFSVAINVGNKTLRTSVTKKGPQRPYWDQSFNFTGLDGDEVKIGFYEKNLHQELELLGEYTSTVADIRSAGPAGEEQKRTIKIGSGESEKSVEFAFKIRDVQDTFGNVDPKRIFALLIGVGKYKSPEVEDLYGPGHDARAMRTFLTEDLNVDRSHIKYHIHEQATRKAILEAFKALLENPEIKRGDTILFYFAGHGARQKVPEDWGWTSTGNMVELICPYDVWMPRGDQEDPEFDWGVEASPNVPVSSSDAMEIDSKLPIAGPEEPTTEPEDPTPDSDRTSVNSDELVVQSSEPVVEPIEPIPDRTMLALFRMLAAKYGDNIITIFDSCHSGGMYRSDGHEGARLLVNSPPISKDTDRNIWTWDITRSPQATRHISSFTYEGATSHIFLAAAKPTQIAYEEWVTEKVKRGAFTKALLTQLKTPDFGQLTYTELISRLPALRHGQQPQCEGANQNRFLFRREGRPRTGMFELKEKTAGMLWELEGIGKVQGVDIGSEFTVWERGESNAVDHRGILVVTAAHKARLTLERRKGDKHFEVPTNAIATVYRFNNFTLKVFIDNSQDDGTGDHRIDLQPSSEERSFTLVDARHEADVFLFKNTSGKNLTKRFVFLKHSTNKIYVDPAPQRLPLSDTVKLEPVLDAVAHFHYHINRTSSSHRLGKDVKMELYCVQRPPRPLGRYTLQDLYTKRVDGVDLLDGRESVTLIENSEASYGIDIVNSSSYDLFVYLFYFDPSDYSITIIFEPSNKKEPTLPHKQSNISRIAIGYGAHGWENNVNLNFNLRPGETTDTGYFKLFVTTQYADMKFLEQKPAFEQPPTEEEDKKNRTQRQELLKFLQGGVWDTFLTRVTVNKLIRK